MLILGESGTGKELVARALYHHSRRADQPFLAINCAAIPETLLESELFGHEQGAFTGADRRRIGKFEQCDGGTLFLDEIGDMSPPLQAKMLRVLQEQQLRAASAATRRCRPSVRVLAATNQDLEQLVAEGRFRKDLYYRLKVVTIHVPPLRDRLDDVAELAHYFLFRFNRELGLDLRGFAPEALELLQSYPWPGNVRELQSVDQAGDAARLRARPAAGVPAGGVSPATPGSASRAVRPPLICGPGAKPGCRRRQGDLRPVQEAVDRLLIPGSCANARPPDAGQRDARHQPRHAAPKATGLGLAIDKVVTRCKPWSTNRTNDERLLASGWASQLAAYWPP